MSDRQRLYVMFNQGGGSAKFYTKLRDFFGDVYIIALARPGHGATAEEQAAADEFRVMSTPHGHGGLGAMWTTVRQARGERVDIVVVFYDSIKLRVFAAALNPGKCAWWRGDGYVVPLPHGIAGTLWQLTQVRTRGLWSLVRIYSAIYLRRFNVYR